MNTKSPSQRLNTASRRRRRLRPQSAHCRSTSWPPGFAAAAGAAGARPPSNAEASLVGGGGGSGGLRASSESRLMGSPLEASTNANARTGSVASSGAPVEVIAKPPPRRKRRRTHEEIQMSKLHALSEWKLTSNTFAKSQRAASTPTSVSTRFGIYSWSLCCALWPLQRRWRWLSLRLRGLRMALQRPGLPCVVCVVCVCVCVCVCARALFTTNTIGVLVVVVVVVVVLGLVVWSSSSLLLLRPYPCSWLGRHHCCCYAKSWFAVDFISVPYSSPSSSLSLIHSLTLRCAMRPSVLSVECLLRLVVPVPVPVPLCAAACLCVSLRLSVHAAHLLAPCTCARRSCRSSSSTQK